MDRRQLLQAGAAATAAASLPSLAAGQAPEQAVADQARRPFRLAYAPHFGMFRHSAGDDPVAQLEWAADQGFTAWEDNGMQGRSIAEQERLAAAMERLGLTMGVFVVNPQTAWKPSFCDPNSDLAAQFIEEVRNSVEVAKRVNAKWMTVVPGTYRQNREFGYQQAAATDLLKRAAEIFEPEGLCMVLEPLNPYRDHPGMLLSKIPQAYEICRAVGSPAVKILFDIYHQQITEGNLIPNIDLAWEEIAYFQIGDNPGRNEPGTGEIHYRNVFRHIHAKGFTGVLGMEHGNSQAGAEGEAKVLAAYRDSDAF